MLVVGTLLILTLECMCVCMYVSVLVYIYMYVAEINLRYSSSTVYLVFWYFVLFCCFETVSLH